MKINKIKSNAKLNLALNITGKKRVLHKIESIISFIDLHDVILINQHNGKKHLISFYGKFSKNIGKKNSVQKLFEILHHAPSANIKPFARLVNIDDATRKIQGIGPFIDQDRVRPFLDNGPQRAKRTVEIHWYSVAFQLGGHFFKVCVFTLLDI